MTLSIIIFLIIVALAIALRTGWRPSFRRTPTTPPPAGTPTTPTGPRIGFFGWAWRSLLIIALAILVFGMGWCGYGTYRWAKTPSTVVVERQVVIIPPPAPISAVTPVTLTLDFHFRIEADGPIYVKYPGEKPVLYIPGKGFQQLPQPGQAGPKVFTDPDNGHTSFRIYPVR